MLSQFHRHLLVLAALPAFGLLRLPFEHGLYRELTQAELLPKPLQLSAGERIGQTAYAVALGGLRTLVATFLNLRAFGFFTEQKWADVETTFNQIVQLAPRTIYYWETGSWHQAYNAASYYLYESQSPALRRRVAWRQSILKGKAFLERAIRNNPQSARLYETLGFLLTDANKLPAFESPVAAFAEAVEAYRRATATGNARSFAERATLYALARIPGREAEALALVRELRTREKANRLPTLLGLHYTLEYHHAQIPNVAELLSQIFASDQEAYDILCNQWLRTRDYFPMHGVAAALQLLEKRLEIPKDQSIFTKPLPAPMDLDDWFGSMPRR